MKEPQQKRLIVVLTQASLETAKQGNSTVLLNSDDHVNLIRKMGKENVRPDILHQSLLALYDSPLNKAGLLQVFVLSTTNQLIQISPRTRIPRTFKRFAGLMGNFIWVVNILINFFFSVSFSAIRDDPGTQSSPIAS